MHKSILAFVLVLTIAFSLNDTLFAQRGLGRGGMGFGRGPATYGLHYDYFDPSGVHQVMASFSRIMPLGMRPGASPTARITTLNLSGGVRFSGPVDSTEFRWRAALFDGNFNRKWLRIGVTIADLNQSGRMKEDYRWVTLRMGPNPHFGSSKIILSPHAVGIIGLGAWELGQINYSKLLTLADSSLSGLEVGYQFGMALALARRVILLADYTERVLVAGPEPRFKTLGIESRLRLGKLLGGMLNLVARYEHEDTELNDITLTQENRQLRVGITLTPIPRRREPNPWD